MKREFTWSLYNEPEITGQGYVMCKTARNILLIVLDKCIKSNRTLLVKRLM